MKNFFLLLGNKYINIKSPLEIYDFLQTLKGVKEFLFESNIGNFLTKANLSLYRDNTKAEYLAYIKMDGMKRDLRAYDIEDIFGKAIEMLVAFFGDFLYLHASGVKISEKKGWIFIGPSGHGKSTVVKTFPKRDILADDRIIIKDEKTLFKIFAVPCVGSKIVLSPGGVVLDKMFFIYPEFSSKSKLRKMKPVEAFLELCKNSIWYVSKKDVKKKIIFMHKLVNLVPCYKLQFSLCDLYLLKKWKKKNG